ncbi:MAG: hypothetical protein IJ782_00350 [Prevotella sp.]|nr:hypothetical protein [Prevotella sp.]
MKKISTLIRKALMVSCASFFCLNTTAQNEEELVVTVPASGHLAIHPSRNFTGPAGVTVTSFFGSNSSGLSVKNIPLGEGVVVASAENSGSGLFLTAKPGTYTLTLTDAEVSADAKVNSTSVSWQQDAGTAYKKSRVLYKFVNTDSKVGFERDETYATDNYQSCTLAEGEHIFTPLAANNVAKIAELMETTAAELAFIPWSDELFGFPEKEVTFDFTSETISDHIGTALADANGNIYNETFTADGATLQVTGGSAASKIYKDNNRGQNLVTYKEYATLTIKAPEGYSITRLDFTAAGNSNINNMTFSSGTRDGMTWTGNAEGVRCYQGGTSYLANIKATLVKKAAGAAALPAIEYTEVANIAAFNALENGTYAKLTLTDAEVIGKSADGYSTVFVQDATGGAWIQYTSLNNTLNEGTKINGTIYTVKRVASGNAQMKETEDTPSSTISAETISEYTTVSCATIDEVNANLGRVVKIEGATVTMTSATAGTLKVGEEEIALNNGNATANQQLHKIDSWVKDEVKENVTVIGIVAATSATKNQILPISIEEAAADWDVAVSTIAEFNAVEDGKVAKLTLTDAKVNAADYGVYYVEDATGATAIKGVTLTPGTALNGYIVGTKGSEDKDFVNDPSQGMEYSLTVTDASLSSYEATATDLTGTAMTITEAAQQANYGRLVKISNVTVADRNSVSKKIVDASNKQMTLQDIYGALSELPETGSVINVTGIVLYYYTGWFIIPVTADAVELVPTAIDGVNADATDADAAIYNVQGVRLGGLQKGINIVNGKKVVVE